MATVRAAGTAERGAKRQNFVVVGIEGLALGGFVQDSLGAGLQHANLYREIGQALKANVLVIVSRIGHGGRTIRDALP